MWALRRRIIILTIIGAFFALFVLLPVIILNYDPPSCTDGKQNQKELGVDCGGPCVRQCTELVDPIRVIWTKAFQSRPGVYYVIAMVENPNPDVGSKRVPYVLQLFDSGGEVIAERNGRIYMLPNERFPVFVGNIVLDEKIPARVEIQFDRNVEWVKMNSEIPKLSVTDRLLSSAETRPRLTAKLLNEGPSVIQDITVMAVISDKRGVPVGGSSTFVDVISPGESAPLAFTWSQPFSYDADTEECTQPVDVILALDRSGSMASDGKSPPQPLTQAKDAAADFVSLLNREDQIGYVSFATDASNPIDQELSRDKVQVQKAIINTEIGKNGVQYTNIGDALARAHSEFRTQRKNPDARSVVVLLTDGEPTYPKSPDDPNFPSNYARQVASVLKQEGISIFTIGLGDDLNEALLQEIASSPEQYYRAATGAELLHIYQSIAKAVCVKAPPLIEVFPRANNVP